MMAHEALNRLYTAINSRSVPEAQPDLCGPTTYCKAIWAIGDWVPTPTYFALVEELEPLKARGILFDIQGTEAQLHWTLFQIQTFPVNPCEATAQDKKDAFALRNILGSAPTFHVQFTGICKTRFGLFLNGFPSTDVNKLREKIRDLFPDRDEPHPQDICHATLFRFTKTPSQADRALLDAVVEKYNGFDLLCFTPRTWEYGYGTWLQKVRQPVASWPATPKWILHRGLTAGPHSGPENDEPTLWQRLADGWDVEIDVWNMDGVLWLGHDRPTTILQNHALLTHPRAWIHCKNLEAVSAMPAGAHYFVHDTDPATLTSQGYVWCYPGNLVTGKPCVAVLPERAGFKFPLLATVDAVCSDYLPIVFMDQLGEPEN